ncbi:hypothetical protein SY88_15525 [Clostridiales bacterium PH28_bin88]|nr:hypothetical protein SY88_15525 [Clostridiales bacterium PH28_bin88]
MECDLSEGEVALQQVVANVFMVKIPVPFPLKYVNCYLFRGSEGWWVVDTGINYPPAQEAWKAVFDGLNLPLKKIKAIYVTHYHPDHYGLAGWLQEQSGAPVFMSEIDGKSVEVVWKSDLRAVETGRFLAANGMPADLVEKIAERGAQTRLMVQPHPYLTTVAEGQEIMLGEDTYQVLYTPGHTDGHMCLYNRREGILLSGDHLLPTITSNISRWPGAAENPLANFLHSLRKIRQLNVQVVLPAHGPVFSSASKRVAEFLDHHEKRLAAVLAAVGRESSAYEVCTKVFGPHLSIYDWRFAMSETITHLDYLRAAGALETVQREKVFYRRNSA